jgi:hypothetical protein
MPNRLLMLMSLLLLLLQLLLLLLLQEQEPTSNKATINPTQQQINIPISPLFSLRYVGIHIVQKQLGATSVCYFWVF